LITMVSVDAVEELPRLTRSKTRLSPQSYLKKQSVV